MLQNGLQHIITLTGWARQDRKTNPEDRSKLAINETAGATRVMTMDLHADQIQGFFEKPVDHLFASTIFLPYVKSLGLDNLTIASLYRRVLKKVPIF
jgi:ribose-phosphate pyrophosphokinase